MSETEKIYELRNIVATLIAWMSGSANSPLSHGEARELLGRLDALADVGEK